MFKLYDPDSESQFSWESTGNIESGRENLGGEMPVLVYRLFQYAIKGELAKQFGKEKTVEIFRNAGELAGIEFSTHVLDLDLPFEAFIDHLRNVLEQYRIGILRVEHFDLDTGRAVLTIGEDLDCSGLPVTGETVCNYDEGFLAGILKTYTRKNYVVTEVDCWATGSRVCRFEAVVPESNS